MKLIYLKSASKCDSFDVGIGIKIPFFRVLVTIELGRSLLQFVTFVYSLQFRYCLTNCDTYVKIYWGALIPGACYVNDRCFPKRELENPSTRKTIEKRR